MNYKEVINYIENSMRFGCRPGLERTSQLLELLDNPHKKLRFVHVAGTNGKGSTTAMTSNIIKNAGYKVGMYISPHLYRNTERMTINGIEISEEEFTSYALRVIDTVNYMKNNNMEEPTQFEMLTAMSFLYFEEKKVDIAVIEVGLGGAYDATNVIESEVAIITSISYDHIDILGSTMKEIATEKAGIIKNNSSVVVYPQSHKQAMEVIEQKCCDTKAKLIKVEDTEIVSVKSDENGHVFNFRNNNTEYKNMKLSLMGDYQLKNAASVLCAIHELKNKGFNISEQSIRKGLETAVWPCRLSIMCKNPMILIDGAHNDEGVNSLKLALVKYFSNKNKVFVFGMLKDKNYSYAVEQLMPLASTAICTEPISPRAMTGGEMADKVRPYCNNVIVQANIKKAVDKAIEICNQDSMICVCGSLYLAGSVYEYINRIGIK